MTVTRKTIALGTGAALLLVAGLSTAQARGHWQQFDFEAMDRDADGFITVTEIMAAAEDRFTRADADGDGTVTKSEMRAALRDARKEPDFAARAAKMIERGDTDGDGALSAAELQAAMETRHAKRAEARSKRRAGDHGGFGRKRGFARFDTNGDGVFTRDDLDDSRAKRLIERLDTDGDGRLSLAEVDAMRAKRRGG